MEALLVMVNMLNSVAVIVGATYAAVYFNRPTILLFYILAALMGESRVKIYKGEGEEKDG